MSFIKAIVSILLIGNSFAVPVIKDMEVVDDLELQTLSLSFLPSELELDDILDFNYESPFVAANISTSKVIVTGLNGVDIKFKVNTEAVEEKKVFLSVQSAEEVGITGSYSGAASQKTSEFSMIPKDYHGAGVFKVHVMKPKIDIVGDYEEDEEGVMQFKDIRVKVKFDKIHLEAENLKYGEDHKLVNWTEVNTMLNGSEYDEMWDAMIQKLMHARLIKLLNEKIKEMKLSVVEIVSYASAFSSV